LTARFHAGEIQDVVQDADQCLGGPLDRGQQLALRRIQRGGGQQLQRTQHAVHRRADLVAHGGEELALGGGGRLGGVTGGRERHGLLTLCGDIDPIAAELHHAVAGLARQGVCGHPSRRRRVADAHLDVQRRAFGRSVLNGVQNGRLVPFVDAREGTGLVVQERGRAHAEDGFGVAADVQELHAGRRRVPEAVHDGGDVPRHIGQLGLAAFAPPGLAPQLHVRMADSGQKDDNQCQGR
jgi:hypothetical protein